MTLVSVEVRVVDKDGNPVRDLTAADFTVREDGVAQGIAHFQAVSVDSGHELATSRRTFLIVLGRGQLNAPTKAVEALIDFVRSKCLPADRVGVVAYLKAIEFTTNHEAVARFLEAFRGRHEAIDGKIAGAHSTMAPDTRASIDALFRQDALQVRDLAAGSGNLAIRFNDFRYLNSALEYLGMIDGDKHVIFVTERPFINIRMADKPRENYWIRQAAGARTALSFIHAGGLKGGDGFRGKFGILGFEPGFIDDQEWMADQTGGTATFFQFADKPLTALDRVTRFHYVLGYYPAREVAPDQFRNIEVIVKRAGARLLYRHGYQAQPRSEELQDYRRAVTEARIAEGAFRLVYPLPRNLAAPGIKAVGIKFVGMSLKVSGGTSSAAEGPLQVVVSFDPSWVYFRKEGAEYAAELDLRLLADDAQRNLVGETTQRLPFTLTAAEFERSQRRLKPQSLTFEATINVKARPAYLRGVLYQFDTDRTASAQLRLQR